MFSILTSIQLFGSNKKFDSKPYLTGNFTVKYQKASDPDNVESKYVIVKPLGEQKDEMVLNVYDDENENEVEDTYYLKWTDSANFSVYKDEEFDNLITSVTFPEQGQTARGTVNDVAYKLSLYGLNVELIIYDSKKGISRVTFTSQRPPVPWYQQYMPFLMMLPMLINMFIKKPVPPQQPQQQAETKKEEKKEETNEEKKEETNEEKKEETNEEKKEETNEENKDSTETNEESKKEEVNEEANNQEATADSTDEKVKTE